MDLRGALQWSANGLLLVRTASKRAAAGSGDRWPVSSPALARLEAPRRRPNGAPAAGG